MSWQKVKDGVHTLDRIVKTVRVTWESRKPQTDVSGGSSCSSVSAGGRGIKHAGFNLPTFSVIAHVWSQFSLWHSTDVVINLYARCFRRMGLSVSNLSGQLSDNTPIARRDAAFYRKTMKRELSRSRVSFVSDGCCSCSPSHFAAKRLTNLKTLCLVLRQNYK